MEAVVNQRVGYLMAYSGLFGAYSGLFGKNCGVKTIQTTENQHFMFGGFFLPVIARVFRELELVEQWGSGIPGIFRQAAADHLAEPLIEEIAGRIRFTVTLPEILTPTREQSRKQ